ncbi:hypothetical protein [Kocuria rhizophila]|uniref:hypothetical protein n=1 Tax=Kocuria rhizophila TaxID=72000 RepID=UPI0011A5C788|nr:hypothetical protein [Kocuria rhizophila]MCG7425096.1 hypothetical protein [Kocuria rhizophila]
MNTSSTLGSLIQERRNSNGWSYRDLESRSPAGTGLNKSRWGELARDEVKTFSGDQLRGIAVALGLPQHVVGRAALTSMGLTADTNSARTLEDAVRAEYHLTDHDRRILLAVVRAMRTESTLEYDTEDHEQEPRTEARGAQPAQSSPMTRAGESPAAEDTAPPVPDEYALAAYDAPSEGRAMRSAQDQEAEASQDGGEWDPA